jgi:hypothetical protein
MTLTATAQFAKTIGLTVLCLFAMLPIVVSANDARRMNDEQLVAKLEDAYKSVKSVEKEKGKVFDIHVERLSYLVLVAGRHSNGSKRLDAIFSKIQKESPTLVVPRFVMNPAELESFIADMAVDDANDQVYSAYRRKVRTMSELIADAKQAITRRSGFIFDPSVQVIRTQ